MRHDEVKAYYERLYDERSDEAFPCDEARYRAWLARVPHLRSPGRVLDIGCGVGFACELMARRGWEVHGIDISESALERARARVPEGHFRTSDEQGLLPYGDESFDLVLCLGVLEHIRQPDVVVQETRRILREGGTAIFMVPNSWSPYFWIGGTGQILELPRSVGGWRRLFETAGLRITAVGRDPGPSWKASFPVRKKIKLALQRVLNRLPVRVTYQFVFTMVR